MKYLFIFMALILGASESRAEENPYAELRDLTCVQLLQQTIQNLQDKSNKKEIYGKIAATGDAVSTFYDVALTDGCDVDTYRIEIGPGCIFLGVEKTQSNG